jgi:adenylate cyclase
MSSEQCEIGILFADVAGSTRLYETLGDSAAHAKVEACLELVAQAVLEAGGTIVKRIGDEIMAALPSATAVVTSAIEIQRKVELRHGSERKEEPELCIRIGFHFGPALKDGADFFGDTVNLAARMVSLARGRQIITTARCAERLEPLHRLMLRSLGWVPIRGKADGIEVAEVLWERELTGMGTVLLKGLSSTARCPELVLVHHGRKWLFDESVHAVSMGRDPHCDLVIEDRRASRNQALIERRSPNWVIVDHSTNGTRVTFKSGDEVELHHAELILHGEGHLAFGHSEQDANAEIVQFALNRRARITH